MRTEPKPGKKTEPVPSTDEVDGSLAATGEFPQQANSPTPETRQRDAVDRREKDKPYRNPQDSGTDGAE